MGWELAGVQKGHLRNCCPSGTVRMSWPDEER